MNNIVLNTGPDHDERTVVIPFPPGENKKLLVSVSGGADSAILLYLIAKHNKDANLGHQITTFTANKVDGAEMHAKKVIQWVTSKLEVSVQSMFIEGDHSLPHNLIVHKPLRDLISTDAFDMLYVGENKIPPIEFPFGEQNSFPGLAPRRKGNPTNNVKVSLPFSDLYKYHTIDLYFRHNVTELLEYTHTCTERSIGRCNVCWQCCERKWAFRELRREDSSHV